MRKRVCKYLKYKKEISTGSITIEPKDLAERLNPLSRKTLLVQYVIRNVTVLGEILSVLLCRIRGVPLLIRHDWIRNLRRFA